MRCVAYRCPDDPLPGGQLCRDHQRRLDRGGGLPRFDEPVKGDPSGHGKYALHDENELGVACHECGERFAGLGQHVRRAHGMSPMEYAERHGIRPKNVPKRPDGRVRRRPHPCYRCKAPITTHGKLCDNCRAARLREVEERQQAKAREVR